MDSMSHRPQDFLNFISSHYRTIAVIYRDDLRFESDDEILNFLDRFNETGKDQSSMTRRLKEVGVLQEMMGCWAMPSFLKDFFAQLEQRFTLASPAVIAAWVQKLRNLVSQFEKSICQSEQGALADFDHVGFLLSEIMDTYQVVNKTVNDNCERISEEVAGYRMTTDAAISKQRMQRLIFLYDEYLEPILQLLTIDGEFRNVSDDVASCCTRLRTILLG